MEFTIPAILLLTSVSAIGNRNIGIKFPVKLPAKPLQMFWGKVCILRSQSASEWFRQSIPLKHPPDKDWNVPGIFNQNKRRPQIMLRRIRRTHFSLSVFIVLCKIFRNSRLGIILAPRLSRWSVWDWQSMRSSLFLYFWAKWINPAFDALLTLENILSPQKIFPIWRP